MVGRCVLPAYRDVYGQTSVRHARDDYSNYGVADDKAGVSYDGATRSWRLTGKDLALSFPKMPEGFVWTAERSSDGADLTRTGLTRAQVVALRDRLTVVLA